MHLIWWFKGRKLIFISYVFPCLTFFADHYWWKFAEDEPPCICLWPKYFYASLRPWNMLKIDPNYTFVVVACSTGETLTPWGDIAHLQQKVVTNMHQKTWSPFGLPFSSAKMSAASGCYQILHDKSIIDLYCLPLKKYHFLSANLLSSSN